MDTKLTQTARRKGGPSSEHKLGAHLLATLAIKINLDLARLADARRVVAQVAEATTVNSVPSLGNIKIAHKVGYVFQLARLAFLAEDYAEAERLFELALGALSRRSGAHQKRVS